MFVTVCLSVASPVSETSKAIAITFDTTTASVPGMHHVLSMLNLTLILMKIMFYFLRNCLSNAHHVCQEDSPTKMMYKLLQSDDLDQIQSPQLRLKRDKL